VRSISNMTERNRIPLLYIFMLINYVFFNVYEKYYYNILTVARFLLFQWFKHTKVKSEGCLGNRYYKNQLAVHRETQDRKAF
jgi:hypothetical protein